jgi:transforming growth factor-beta-induced protein
MSTILSSREGLLRMARLILLSVLIAFTSGCSDDDKSPSETQNVLQRVQNNDDLSTLADAIQDANLDEALEGEGPFTIFAPTNIAFDRLPAGYLTDLTSQEVAQILSYHVVASEIRSTSLQAEQMVNSLEGGALFVTKNSVVEVNDTATVSVADILATNGVIHVIDNVLLPDRFQTIYRVIRKRYNLETLQQAIESANLVQTLEEDTQDGYTIFAPDDQAFEDLGVDLSTLTTQELQDILTYHVLPQKLLSGDITSGTVTTVNGADVTITVSNGSVMLTDQANNTYSVTQADIEGNNGVVHLIDGVLQPSGN